jgi:hypothetical protein
VDALLGKMMAKRPEDRYQSMKQVIHDLDRLKVGKPIGRAPAGGGHLSGGCRGLSGDFDRVKTA